MYLFPHSEWWFPAYWRDSSYPECCSEPDSSAKFLASKALELFRVWVSPESTQALSASVLIQPYQERESPFPGLEKPFPAARSLVASFLESASIPECWFPDPESSQSGCSPFRFRLLRNSCLRPPCQPRYPRPRPRRFQRQSEVMPASLRAHAAGSWGCLKASPIRWRNGPRPWWHRLR